MLCTRLFAVKNIRMIDKSYVKVNRLCALTSIPITECIQIDRKELRLFFQYRVTRKLILRSKIHMLAGKYRPIVTELFDCAKPCWTKKSQWILIVYKNENRYVYMGYKVMLVQSRTKAEYLPALSLPGRSCKPISLHRFITGRADTGIVRHFLLASNFSCFQHKNKNI